MKILYIKMNNQIMVTNPMIPTQLEIEQQEVISPIPSQSFEWIYVFFSFWFLSGLYWDAWAHTHIPEQESFFSIYHLVMYSGAVGLSGTILYKVSVNYSISGNLSKSIPVGYSPALAGVIVFMGGGAGDLVWHELFGIENDLEAAFSPTHLLLMFGIQFFLVAPFYAAWVRGETNSGNFISQLPKILSFGFLLSGLMVITQWAHPFVITYSTQPRDFGSEAIGILSFFVQSVLLMGLLLLALKEKILPAGSYTIALTLNAVALTLMRDNFAFIPIAVLTGIVVDIFVFQNIGTRKMIRSIAFIVPSLYFALYFVVLSTIATITWSMHLIAGGVAMGIAVSLLVSLFILPPERQIIHSS